ncbi:MAG TPA: sigma-E factor negative regulatory protein [Gammaproteobacteria bacterium]|nr:sigma-E factor negative regulatory protein [Gammaproteobacteria bacterium]
MTDQINDQISAFIDNELTADESALLVRRFERDSEARARAMRYTLIGASLRGELLEPHPSVLRQRIAAALSGNAVPSVPKAREPWSDKWARPLIGLGIAATVAAVAIGTLRSLNEASLPGAALPAGPSVVQVTDRDPAYVVPQPNATSGVGGIRLTNYLMHHGEFASGLTRTSVNSNVLGGAMEPPPTVASEGAVSPAKPVVQQGAE